MVCDPDASCHLGLTQAQLLGHACIGRLIHPAGPLRALPAHQLVAMPRAVTLTKVGAAAVTLPGENMHAVLSEHRLREVAAVKTIHEENVARTQMRHQGTE